MEQLPFDIYQVNYLPPGTKIISIEDHYSYSGMERDKIIISTKISTEIKKNKPYNKRDKWKIHRVEIHQMKFLEQFDFPTHCPGGSFSINVKSQERFTADCEFVTETAQGHKLYEAQNIISFRVNDTIILIDLVRSFRKEDVSEISRLVDSMTIMSRESLKEWIKKNY